LAMGKKPQEREKTTITITLSIFIASLLP